MKILFAAAILFFSSLCLAQSRSRLVCNVMVDPVPSVNPAATFRVDQFLFDDPDKADALVFWHPWGGARINMLSAPVQKTKTITHRVEAFPNTFTMIVAPEGRSYQFKIKLTQTAATGTDYSLIDVKYGIIDSSGEVKLWEDFNLKDPSNGNQPAGGCRYNKQF